MNKRPYFAYILGVRRTENRDHAPFLGSLMIVSRSKRSGSSIWKPGTSYRDITEFISKKVGYAFETPKDVYSILVSPSWDEVRERCAEKQRQFTFDPKEFQMFIKHTLQKGG